MITLALQEILLCLQKRLQRKKIADSNSLLNTLSPKEGVFDSTSKT